MDLNPYNIVAQGAMGGAVMGALYLIKRYARRKRLQGCLLLVGKSTVCHKLSDTKTYFLDLDEYVKANNPEMYEKYKNDGVQYVLNCFPLVVRYIEKILTDFTNKKLVLVSQNLELLQQFGLKKIRAFLPDKELIDTLNLEDNDKAVMSVKKFEAGAKVKKYKVYNNWEELYGMLRRKYQLKQKLKI